MTTTFTRKTSTQQTIANPSRPIQLPCPSHPQFPISHLCLSSTCQQSISFCSECLFDQTQQQHIAKHKESVIAWADFIGLCRKMSCSGRLGDISSDHTNLVLQTHIHQQQFKSHFKNQEQLINQEFDSLIQQFTADVNKIKSELLAQFKHYSADLQELGEVVEKMVHEYYQNKGETKDYNNDFDLFLKEVIKIQDIQSNPKLQQQFSLRRLMQNIIPLVARANSSFQRNLPAQGDDNQSTVTGLSLFSSFSIKNPENNLFADITQEYKQLLKNKPIYKNQGCAQKVYQSVSEELQRIYHRLSENVCHFVTPNYRANLKNKENVSDSRSRFLNSPSKSSQFKKSVCDKSSMIIDNYIKAQKTRQLKQLVEQENQSDDEAKELVNKQVFVRQTNSACLPLGEGAELVSLDHTKTVGTEHKGGINCMVMVDEDYIATGSNDKTVRIFRYRTYEQVKEIAFKSDVTCLATLLRSDGSSMLVVGLYKAICLVNQGFEIVRYFEGQSEFISSSQNNAVLHSGQINSIVAANDGQTVLSCAQTDNKLIQWNLMDGSQPKKYFEHRDSITCLALVGSDMCVASAGKDRNVRVFRMMYYDKDFKQGALDKLQLSLSINDAHSTEITALGSSPSILFSMSSTGELKLWDLNDGSLYRTIKNYNGWGFKIMYFYSKIEDEIEQSLTKTKKERRVTSPGRKQSSNQIVNELKAGSVGIVSFDGTLKLFSGHKLITEK